MKANEGSERASIVVRLCLRLALYFVAIVVVMLMVREYAPDIYDILPFGGLDTIEERALLEPQFGGSLQSERAILEVISTAVAMDFGRLEAAVTLMLSMLGALILMIPVAWVYRAINADTEYDHSLAATIVLLPSVVASIVIIVQFSLAIAFGLAGIAAAVRFRRALIDTTDTLFIFVAIAVGIAAGIEALGIAFVLTLFFCFACTLIGFSGEGLESHQRMKRKEAKRQLREQAANAVEQGTETPDAGEQPDRG